MVFDFGSIENNEKTIRNTWEEFRDSLATGKYTYDQPELALQDTFLKVVNDLLHDIDVRKLFTISLEDMISLNTKFCRGAKLKTEENVSYERFIPKKEYINEDNRFSPKGYEWLYLSLQNTQSKGNSLYKPMEECCICECRIKDGDRVGLCNFALNNDYSSQKIIDLTIGIEYTFDAINDSLENSAKASGKKTVNNFMCGKGFNFNREEVEFEIKKWAAHTYGKLMSKQLFVPLETDDKELTYAPFQCLAQYFISQGFCGIIYKSTVYRNVKNIVLFDKSYASPTGTIKDVIYKNGTLSI